MTKLKRSGGIIKDWVILDLKMPKTRLQSSFPNKKVTSKVFMGTVVQDPTGRWDVGMPIRSSLIVDTHRDAEDYLVVETLNTVYRLQGPGEYR